MPVALANFRSVLNDGLLRPLSKRAMAVCEVFMHPQQLFAPKLSLAVQRDGTLVSPPLEDLSPLLPREVLRDAMLVGTHPKSEQLVP